MMTERELGASDFIVISLFNPVPVKSRQLAGCYWEAEGTSLSLFNTERSVAVPSHKSEGTTWLSDGRVYLARLRTSKSSWEKKIFFQFHYFYNLIFQLVGTTHAEPLPSKTYCDSCLGLACDFHGSGGLGELVGAQLLRFVQLPWRRTSPAFAQRRC